MDEQLIREVERHAIIYNRQKKSIGIKGEEHIGKEFAWIDIATRLGTDVDTCKKRWKYLRERYVQQKKQGDSGGPMYEHLSRPYLEKMKFLDRYIQPRKSYRGSIPGLLNCSNGNNSLHGDMPDSKSNGSSNLTLPVMCRIAEGLQKFEYRVKTENDTIDMMDSNEPHQRPHTSSDHENMQSTSSPSVTSILSPPPLIVHDNENTPTNNVSSNSYDGELHNTNSDNDDDDDDNIQRKPDRSSSIFYSNGDSGPPNGPPYPHLPFAYPANFNHHYNNIQPKSHRNSDELLGELVTTELMKMNGERKKHVQKKILQILFFED